MGCDGGTIPKRDELVKTKKRPEQKEKAAERAFRWKNCAVSQAPLQQPIVACEMGRIYNKDTIIETLLDKSNAEAAAADSALLTHIRTLRDVKVLNLTENPTWAQSSNVEKGDGYIDEQKAQWICPVSGQEMSGKFRFVFVWTCGCVFSERALKEMTKTKQAAGVTVHECLKCQKSFDISDVVLLNPTEEDEIESLRSKMEARRTKVKESKKAKKASKSGEPAPSTSTSTSADPSEPCSSKSEKRKADDEKQKNGLKAASSSKKPKLDKLEEKDPKMFKLTGKYSVASDPKASQIYKSLFTSSEKGQDQQRAHWVTYNPFYN